MLLRLPRLPIVAYCKDDNIKTRKLIRFCSYEELMAIIKKSQQSIPFLNHALFYTFYHFSKQKIRNCFKIKVCLVCLVTRIIFQDAKIFA